MQSWHGDSFAGTLPPNKPIQVKQSGRSPDLRCTLKQSLRLNLQLGFYQSSFFFAFSVFFNSAQHV